MWYNVLKSSLELEYKEKEKKLISGYEAMYMVRKGQASPEGCHSYLDQVKLVEGLFNIG